MKFILKNNFVRSSIYKNVQLNKESITLRIQIANKILHRSHKSNTHLVRLCNMNI